MALETAEDRAAYIADFGVQVTWTHDATASVFLGIFDRPTSLTPGQGEVDFVERFPTITFPETDLPSGAAEDDSVSIYDEFGTHNLRCRTIRPDDTGFVTVDLKA